MVLILRTNNSKRVEIFILIKLYAALRFDLRNNQTAVLGAGMGSVGSTAQLVLLIAVEPPAPAVIHA